MQTLDEERHVVGWRSVQVALTGLNGHVPQVFASCQSNHESESRKSSLVTLTVRHESSLFFLRQELGNCCLLSPKARDCVVVYELSRELVWV